MISPSPSNVVSLFTTNCTLLLLISISTTSCFTFSTDVEYFGSKHSTFFEIRHRRQYSKYRSLTPLQDNSQPLPNFNNKIITNLEPSLHPYQSCLVHLINYDGIDISLPSASTPIVLSRYDIVESHYFVKSRKLKAVHEPLTSFRKRMFPFGASLPVNNTTGDIQWCKRNLADAQCVDVPYLDMSPKMKPWLCEAHLYLFPPKDDLSFYQVFESYDDSKQFAMIVPATLRRFWYYVATNAQEDVDVEYYYLIVSRDRHDILVTEDDSSQSFITSAWTTAIVRFQSGVTFTPTGHQFLTLLGTNMGFNRVMIRNEISLENVE